MKVTDKDREYGDKKAAELGYAAGGRMRRVLAEAIATAREEGRQEVRDSVGAAMREAEATLRSWRGED